MRGVKIFFFSFLILLSCPLNLKYVFFSLVYFFTSTYRIFYRVDFFHVFQRCFFFLRFHSLLLFILFRMIFFFFLEFSSTCGNSRRISLSPVLLSPFSPAIVLPTFSRGKLLKRPVELYWLSLFSPKTELVFLSFSPLFVPSLLLILSCSLSLSL